MQWQSAVTENVWYLLPYCCLLKHPPLDITKYNPFCWLTNNFQQNTTDILFDLPNSDQNCSLSQFVQPCNHFSEQKCFPASIIKKTHCVSYVQDVCFYFFFFILNTGAFRRVWPQIIWRKQSSCSSSPATRALWYWRCVSMMCRWENTINNEH